MDTTITDTTPRTHCIGCGARISRYNPHDDGFCQAESCRPKPVDHEGQLSEWISGPGLVAWIEEEEGGTIERADLRLGFHARRLRSWRDGDRAKAETADLVLNKLGLCLGQVPHHLYVEGPYAERSHGPYEERPCDQPLVRVSF